MGFVFPRAAGDCIIFAWILWMLLFGMFLFQIYLQIDVAKELANNPPAQVVEFYEKQMRLPAFLCCPFESSSESFPIDEPLSPRCSASTLHGDVSCHIDYVQLNSSKEEMVKSCVLFNGNRTITFTNALDSLILFHRVNQSLVSDSQGGDVDVTIDSTSIRAYFVVPIELSKDQIENQFVEAFSTLNPDRMPIKQYGMGSMRAPSIFGITKSKRKYVNGDIKVSYAISSTSVTSFPSIQSITNPIPLNQTDYIFAAINVDTFKVISTEEKDPLGVTALLGLIGGAWFYVPFLFGIFFGYDEEEKKYYFRGIQGTIKAILGGAAKTNQAVTNTTKVVESSSIELNSK